MAMSAVYTTVNGRMAHEVRSGVESFYTPDPLGSLAEVRDAGGNRTYQAEYRAYGEVRAEMGTNPSPWGFVGLLGYLRDLAGLLYVRARHYRPGMARWQTVDPLWPDESAYGYVGGSPSQYVDPSGMSLVIPVPRPVGISPQQWAAIIQYLESLGLGLAEITALLSALVLIIGAVVFTCAAFQRLRGQYCPSRSRPSAGLRSCKEGDGCYGTIVLAEEWANCAIVQAVLNGLCFPGDSSHDQILNKYLEDFINCAALVDVNCNPVRCARRWLGF